MIEPFWARMESPFDGELRKMRKGRYLSNYKIQTFQ